MHLLVLLLGVALCVGDEITRYHGYKVFRITPNKEEQLTLLQELQDDPNFDFWNGPRKIGSSDVMVTPEAEGAFKDLLLKNNVEFEVLIEDVEKVFEAERQLQNATRSASAGRINFQQYQRYDDINSYLRRLEAEYPHLVTLELVTVSTEGREIYGIKISTSGGTIRKPIILLDGGIHAREWIAPATALYAIQELVENPANYHLLESIDWHVIPLVNPDGYEFTHTTTRLWRKTRSNGTTCIGVDANRNFDYHWMGQGASNNECSDIYAGPRPFSEPETAGIRDWVFRYENLIEVYVNIHSYGSMILYPWGYDYLLPDNWVILHNLGVLGARGIASIFGTTYTVGSSANVLYAAAGGADDWVKAGGGVPVTYTYELPGGGSAGFDLPPDRIQAVVRETWEAFIVLHDYAQLMAVQKL